MLITFDEIRKNKIKSFILVIFFILLIGAIGAAFGIYVGNVYSGLIIATIIGVVYSLIVYNQGDKMIQTMSGARPVKKSEFPHLYHTIEGLAVAAGVPTPKAYVIEDSAMNAFATGKDPEHASITVTTGLLKVMDRQELEGVIAHEMSHIKHYDIRLMMLTVVMIGIVTLLSDFMLRSMIYGGRNRNSNNNSNGIMLIVALVLAILAPIIGQMIKLAISRKREYAADAGAAELTRYPPGIAGALKKISKDPDPLVDKANKATAHLFISVPFRKKGKGRMSKLFLTHPPIEDRIKRLEEM